MKITNISYERLDLKLSQPYTIAYETVSEVVNFVLKLETDQGLIGYGCAVPDPIVTRETSEQVETFIKDAILSTLKGRSPFMFHRIMEDLRQLPGAGASAMAMTDMALLDLQAKKMGVPLYKYLGGYRNQIATSVTVGICSAEDALILVKELVKKGLFIIKIKGGIDIDEDLEKMKQIRRDFPEIRLRFDGNQGYTLKQALRFAKEAEALDIEVFEQPLSSELDMKLKDLKEKIRLPLMVDESLKSLEDAYYFSKDDQLDLFNIKLMKVGGILKAREINSVARAAGIRSMVGCLDESAIGISAGLHFALSDSNVMYADLDGHLDLEGDPYHGLFELKDGFLIPGTKPGIGN